MKQVTINQNDAGQRVDKFLQKYFKTAMPLSMIYKSIRKKRVKVNGKRTDIHYILNRGDVLDLYINDSFFEQTPQPARRVAPQFGVVYEDENLLLMDKAAGVVVHDDDRGSVNTLVAQMTTYLIEKGEYQPERENSFAPALCNRIDRNTAGIVIAAKNAQALREMNEIIKHRMVKKTYLAIVTGRLQPASATLTDYLFKDSKQNRVYVTHRPQRGASKIVTKYHVLRPVGENTLVEVELVTGKTHQIRAHFASIGHPLLGDGKYGTINKACGLKFQALHAYRLSFLSGFEHMNLSYLQGKEFTSRLKPFGGLTDTDFGK